MKNFNFKHPELRPELSFLATVGPEGIETFKKQYKTLEVGNQPYGTDGSPLPKDDNGFPVPVFAETQEIAIRKMDFQKRYDQDRLNAPFFK